MKTNNERRFIVVDEDMKPMTYSERDQQFCFVPTRGRSRFKLKTYTEKEAKSAIKKTVEYRKNNNFSIGEYHLMPIKL